MRILTGRGAVATLAAAGSVVAGLVWRYPGLTALGAALLLVVMLDVFAALGSGAIDADRTIEPQVVERGASCTGTLRVSSRRGRLPVVLQAREPVGSDPADAVRVAVPEPARPRAGSGAAPGTRPGTTPGATPGSRSGASSGTAAAPEQVEVSYAIPTRRRGVLLVGPLQVSRLGAFGLARRSEVVGETVAVRVLPARIELTGLPRGQRRASVGADERVEHGGTDLVGLHEYVPGDDLRRLHWATSARTGTLMVRDDADPSQPRLLVLLDDRADSYLDDEDFEAAVEIASALVRAAAADGRQLHLRSLSGQVDLELGTDALLGGDGSQAMALALAEVQLAGAAPAAGAGAGADRVVGPGGSRGAGGSRGFARSGARSGSSGSGGPGSGGSGGPAWAPTRDLDVALAVTGSAAEKAEFAVAFAPAGDAVLVVVDPQPLETAETLGALLVLRGPTAHELGRLWSVAVLS